MNRHLIIFAREPQEGLVKTRMLKEFSPPVVGVLYKAFLSDICQKMSYVDANRTIFYAGKNHPQFLSQFRPQFHLKKQQGRSLGERMHNAFQQTLGANDEAIIIGTDCLTLSANYIHYAFRILNQYDTVIGPARDGGYYLIGLKRPSRFLFASIAWGSSLVFSQTIARLQARATTFAILKKQSDMDEGKHLHRQMRSSHIQKANPNTWDIYKQTLQR